MHLRLRTKMETVYARIKASGKVLITGNKEAYDTVFGFSWDFPEFYQAQSLGLSIGIFKPWTSTLSAHYSHP